LKKPCPEQHHVLYMYTKDNDMVKSSYVYIYHELITNHITKYISQKKNKILFSTTKLLERIPLLIDSVMYKR